MIFSFGDNLKALRKEKGLTQEQTAELLNISKQSISRWETNTTYPDVLFLPVLASFYGITVDRLLGVDHETNDRIKAEYFAKRQAAHHNGDISAAYELSQKLYAHFPNDTDVINSLMGDTYLMGFHESGDKRTHYLTMSIAIADRFLKITQDIDEQCRCIRNIATCHKLLGNKEEAVRWVQKLPSAWSGIENAGLAIWEGKDRADSIQHSLDAVLHLTYRLLWAYAENPELPPENRIRILEKIPALFQLLFEEGDYGFYHAFLSRTHLELAKANPATAMHHVQEAVAHAEAWDAATPTRHTSLLFCGQGILPSEWTKAGSDSQKESILRALTDTAFDGLRDNPAFAKIVNMSDYSRLPCVKGAVTEGD